MNLILNKPMTVALLLSLLVSLIKAFEDDTEYGLLDDFNLKIMRNLQLHPWKAKPFPSAPFQLVWNAPTESCAKRYNISVEPHKYGVLENPDNGWIGPYATLIYGSHLGHPKDWPQTANVSLMLETAIDGFKKLIPDENFEGLGILDWESWFPRFKTNTGRRQHFINDTINLVRRRHPDWPQDKIELMAEVEWNSATRSLMTSILTLAKACRPKGIFGFYRFPMWNSYHKDNDELGWLFREMDILFPSAYLADGFGLKNQTERYRGHIQETLRIKKKFNLTYKPTYMYSRYGFSGPRHPLYSKAELNMTLYEAAYAGFDGLVYWGDGYSSMNKDACLKTKNFVDQILGPLSTEVLKFTKNCSDSMCNGNGKCVLNEGTTKSFHCSCFEGYTGKNCNKKGSLV